MTASTNARDPWTVWGIAELNCWLAHRNPTFGSPSGHDAEDIRTKELTSTTKRQRRVSEFDWALLRRAATLNAPTDIALTFVDYITKANEKARRFEQLTADTIRFIEEVERVAAAPVSLVSTRFHSRSIIDRRMW